MNTRKILINADYGGFDLSDQACELYLAKKNLAFSKIPRENPLFGNKCSFQVGGDYWSPYKVQRDDPILIEVVEQLGLEKSAGVFASLKIVEIPADVDWEIFEYDGNEEIHEKKRKWS